MPTEPTLVHRVAVPVNIELWQQMLTEGFEQHMVCQQGMPEGATFVGASYDPELGALIMIFDHPSFKAVALGRVLPRLTPIMGTLFCGHSVTDPI